MKNSDYNIINALIYELIIKLADHYKSLKNNTIVKLILAYCKDDWVLWKVELTLKDVDRQIENLHKEWDKQKPKLYTKIEHEPDGSTAQSLLGGAIEIKSNFRRD